MPDPTNNNNQQNIQNTPPMQDPPIMPPIISTPTDNSQGSAAPSVSFPDLKVEEPKKKFGGGKGKVIATILGLMLLVGGLGTGVFLSLQNQNPQEKAAPAEPCKICSGNSCVNGPEYPNCSNTLNECTSSSQCTSKVCTPNDVGRRDCTTSQNCPGFQTRSCNGTGSAWLSWSSCQDKTGDNCPAAPITPTSCMTLFGTETGLNCTPSAVQGSTLCSLTQAPNAGKNAYCCPPGYKIDTAQNKCVNPLICPSGEVCGGSNCATGAGSNQSCQIGSTDALGHCCKPITCTSPKINCGGSCVDTNTDTNHCGGCDGSVCPAGIACKGGFCQTACPAGQARDINGKCSILAGNVTCAPGTESKCPATCASLGVFADCRLSGWYPTQESGGAICKANNIKCSYTNVECMDGPTPADSDRWCILKQTEDCSGTCGSTSTPKPPTPTPTPTPPPTTAQCVNVKAYSSTWTLLTDAQLKALKSGNAVNFCVVGSASAGSFDKAKFTINGTAQAETTTKRPNTQDYCQSYTIPANTYSFNVTAQIHHITLGWK